MSSNHRSAARRGFGILLGVCVTASLGGPLTGRDTKEPASPAAVKGPDIKKSLGGLGKSGDADVIQGINQKIAEKWKANKLTPSSRASDFEFLRRASLDIIGRIANLKEFDQFFKDPPTTRRAQLIERLLKSDEYANNWANIWTVWLMTRTGANDTATKIYHEQMHAWLEKQFVKENASYKDLVTELLTATGKTNSNGAVNYILAHLGEPNPQEEVAKEGKYNMVPLTWRTTRLFLGQQTQCAQCHPHPFNKEFTQQHFWGINVFFRQVDTPKGRPDSGRMAMEKALELTDNPEFNPTGKVFYEQRNGVVMPAKAVYLLENKDPKFAAPNSNRRQDLAKYITESPNFPRAYVNRIWQHFFGRGFTNPVDDFTPENEPSHPELLDQLGSEFVHYGYDPRRLIRWICNSEAYNLSSVATKSNEKTDAEPFFSRMLLKSLTPEQLFESLIVATQAEMFESKESKKKLRDNWMKNLTTNFGDDEGNEVTFNGTVVQALMMMNGGDLNNAVSSTQKGTVAMGVALHKGPGPMIDYVYKAALNRPPTGKETGRILQIYEKAPVNLRNLNAVNFWQDLFWALLNSNEFVLNH